MRVQEIMPNRISDGPGVRVAIFVSGCEFACPGCFNEEIWSFEAGEIFTKKQYDLLYSHLDKDYVDGLTVLGGEPLHPNNINGVYDMIKKVREDFPEKSIWVYSGFTIEQLKMRTKKEPILIKILENIDTLVDGLFVEELRDPSLDYRGSSNQRILHNPSELL